MGGDIKMDFEERELACSFLSVCRSVCVCRCVCLF